MHSTTRVLATVGLAVAGTMLLCGPAAAAPVDGHVGNPKASCLGTAMAEHGPAGEVAGEVAGLRAFLAGSGLSRGDVVSRFAQADATTHKACEAALLQIDFGAPRGGR